MQESMSFDDRFEAMTTDAKAKVSDLAAELCNIHGFDTPVILQAMRGAINYFESYLLASPAVCMECGEEIGECDDEDDLCRPSDN